MISQRLSDGDGLTSGHPLSTGLDFEKLLAVQTLLDRQNFSCGTLDGQMHGQTRAALQAWQRARGLPVSGEADAATLRRLGSLSDALGYRVVTEADHAGLAPLPDSWLEKSKRSRLGYGTVLEKVAEQCHASEAALQRLNPDAAWPDPCPSTRLRLPEPGSGRYVEIAKIVIGLEAHALEGFDAQGRLVLHFPCSIARDKAKRPAGELKIINAASNPNYTFDPEIFQEDPEAQAIGRRLLIPPGPNNPVGLAWLSLSLPGYGIHGTAWPEDIGKTESHGCFRLSNWNARKLVRWVKIGTPVVVEP